MKSLLTSLRLVAVTMLVCVGVYTLVILGFARIVSPVSAAGSLITTPDGTVVGSRLIAQKFTQPRYFWPRPSAVDYNGAGAGGSNKSPTSEDLKTRAEEIIAKYGATPDKPLPPELTAASGAGLDPHITERAARYQVARVAEARGLPEAEVEAIVEHHAFASAGFLAPARLVNVLELNLALDARSATRQVTERDVVTERGAIQ